jgi:hypothetical protein
MATLEWLRSSIRPPPGGSQRHLIVFVVSRGFAYTVRAFHLETAGPEVRVLDYDRLLEAQVLEWATYVFTDLDRLSAPQLRAAAMMYRTLRAAGMTALNDPARVPSRFGLLRKLHDLRFNRFNAYRAEEGVVPQRWPVFLRSEGEHGFPKSGLLQDADALQRALQTALERGHPLPGLLIVEYAAEAVRPGLFRKFASFQIGKQSFAHTCVHDDNWIVKYGKKGIAGESLYEEELQVVRENPFRARTTEAFQIAGIEYGRVDFGIVQGEPQVYEINTNPEVKFELEHPFAQRVESYRLFRHNFLAALAGIDTPKQARHIKIQRTR